MPTSQVKHPNQASQVIRLVELRLKDPQIGHFVPQQAGRFDDFRSGVCRVAKCRHPCGSEVIADTS